MTGGDDETARVVRELAAYDHDRFCQALRAVFRTPGGHATARRDVHLMAGERPACGAPVSELAATDAHGDGCAAYVTCQACKWIRPGACTVPAEGTAI